MMPGMSNADRMSAIGWILDKLKSLSETFSTGPAVNGCGQCLATPPKLELSSLEKPPMCDCS